MKLLVVDDPELLLLLQPTFVRRAGVRVLTGRDADETLGKALELRPDLVVLDGESWGAACCSRIKRDRELGATPVVLLGGKKGKLEMGTFFISAPRGNEECPHFEFPLFPPDACIERPLEREGLLATLRRYVAVPERSYVRSRAALEVTLFDGAEERRGSTKDVSRDGLFLRCAAPPAAGREVRLVVQEPGGGRPISATAHVVRSVPAERDSHLVPGAALRLVEISSRDRTALDRLVAAGS